MVTAAVRLDALVLVIGWVRVAAAAVADVAVAAGAGRGQAGPVRTGGARAAWGS